MDATLFLKHIVHFYSCLGHRARSLGGLNSNSLCSLRDAETESQHISPRPKLKRSRIDGFEAIENEEQPAPKRQTVEPLAFTHIKAVTIRPPICISNLTEPAAAPSEPAKPKSAGESIRRSVAELLEQEKALRAQPRNAPSSPTSPTKDRKNSTPSMTDNQTTPTRGERLDRAVVERRRLHILNIPAKTKKRDVVRTQISFWHQIAECYTQ